MISRIKRKSGFRVRVLANNKAKYWNDYGGYKCEGPWCTFSSIDDQDFDADHRDSLGRGGLDDADLNGQLLCRKFCHPRKTASENSTVTLTKRLNALLSSGLLEYAPKSQGRIFGIENFRIEIFTGKKKRGIFVRGFPEELYKEKNIHAHSRGFNAHYIPMGDEETFLFFLTIAAQRLREIRNAR